MSTTLLSSRPRSIWKALLSLIMMVVLFAFGGVIGLVAEYRFHWFERWTGQHPLYAVQDCVVKCAGEADEPELVRVKP